MPDEVSRDGSPVAAYAALTAEPDLSAVRALIGGSTTVLDLGCGPGRIADPLAAHGRDVVAVDESAAMLRRVAVASPHLSEIATLRLGRTFDAVLLLSQLINGADADALLRTATEHLRPGGLFVAQRLPPGMTWQSGSSRLGPVEVDLVEATIDHGRIDGVTKYSLGDRSWVQTWRLYELPDDAAADLVERAGLRLVSIDGAWLTATSE